MIAQISLSLLIAIFFILLVFLCVSCHIIKNQAGEQFEIREVPPSPPSYTDEKGFLTLV